jgi:POT family proton-dependent oligopeptide transporter
VTARATGEWFGQPRGLTILFLTEMWEYFSYYGMRTLLVYYMTRQLLLGQAQSSVIYGLYTAGFYLTPILGGIVCDRWLGRRRSVLIGGAIMAVGHFMMASEALFYPALVTIALGNGLFLPSLPAEVGGLYRADDPRRPTAYNVYYVGLNLGAFIAPLACGTVGELYGWHWGFTLAGIGMMFGLAVYVAGRRYLAPEEPPRARSAVADTRTSVRGKSPVAGRFLLFAGIAATVVVFRGAYEQLGNTVALWADKGIDRALTPAWSVPMTWFQSLNPLVVFLFTPLLLAYWQRKALRTGRTPSSAARMAFGAALVALSYIGLAAVAAAAESSGAPANLGWLVAFFVAITTGELYILPIGLGLFARLAPHGYAATAVATWFLAAFFGNLLAGALGSLWSGFAPSRFFALMAAVAGAAAVLLLLFVRAVGRAEGAERQEPVQSTLGSEAVRT